MLGTVEMKTGKVMAVAESLTDLRNKIDLSYQGRLLNEITFGIGYVTMHLTPEEVLLLQVKNRPIKDDYFSGGKES